MNISTIPNRVINLDQNPEHFSFIGPMMIDGDGSGGNLEHDPDFQPDTTLHHSGHALNARTVPFAVAPPCVIHGTKGRVMGCKGRITRISTGQSVDVVWADIGPHSKAGEASISAAAALGVPASPTTGGDERFDYRYEGWPDDPALINGISYSLQSY